MTTLHDIFLELVICYMLYKPQPLERDDQKEITCNYYFQW